MFKFRTGSNLLLVKKQKRQKLTVVHFNFTDDYLSFCLKKLLREHTLNESEWCSTAINLHQLPACWILQLSKVSTVKTACNPSTVQIHGLKFTIFELVWIWVHKSNNLIIIGLNCDQPKTPRYITQCYLLPVSHFISSLVPEATGSHQRSPPVLL